VGSVDKCNGQEAPVCILSSAPVMANTAPAVWLILDKNRINVAISRAQCLAVVVADPRIAGAIPGSVDEMMLINLFCKLVQQPSSRMFVDS
jgi:superfamily I DNA and/or RNA helicase